MNKKKSPKARGPCRLMVSACFLNPYNLQSPWPATEPPTKDGNWENIGQKMGFVYFIFWLFSLTLGGSFAPCALLGLSPTVNLFERGEGASCPGSSKGRGPMAFPECGDLSLGVNQTAPDLLSSCYPRMC